MPATQPTRARETDMTKIMVPCECAGTCSYLIIDRWDHMEGWDDEFYADVYVRPVHPTLRYRLKQAKRAFLGQQTGQDMCIQRPQMENLRDWLDELLQSPAEPT